jgi:RimJ/RimL family protein N-acetyltransferase
MSSFEIIEKVRNEYTHYGLNGVIKKTYFMVKKYVFFTSESTWYECDVKSALATEENVAELDCEYLQEDKSSIIEWIREKHMEFPWMYFEKEINSSIQNKHIYMTIKSNGKYIGYIKVGLGKTYIHDFDGDVVFPRDTAFIYDTFVSPAWRGKNISSYGLNVLSCYLKNKGLSRIICHIEDWNTASIRTFTKSKFRPVCKIRFVRVWKYSFFLRDKMYPFSDLAHLLDQFDSKKTVA